MIPAATKIIREFFLKDNLGIGVMQPANEQNYGHQAWFEVWKNGFPVVTEFVNADLLRGLGRQLLAAADDMDRIKGGK